MSAARSAHFASLIILTILFGCDESQPTFVRLGLLRAATMQTAGTINIRIGEQGDAFLARNHQAGHIDKQPAGLNFYEIPLSVHNQATINFEHGPQSLEIGNVIDIQATQDMAKHVGIQHIHLGSGISSSETIMHDEARRQVVALLHKIRRAGWEVYISPSSPRLRGKEGFNATLANGKPSFLDGDYEPTLAEWMKIDNAGWAFYAKNVLLTIRLQRDETHLDLDKPGAYFLSLDFDSAESFFEGYSPNDRLHWRDHWAEIEPVLQKSRSKYEAEAIARGLNIDTHYKEMPRP